MNEAERDAATKSHSGGGEETKREEEGRDVFSGFTESGRNTAAQRATIREFKVSSRFIASVSTSNRAAHIV